MNPKQIVDILEDQPYYMKTNQQKLIYKKPVVIKSNDDKNLQLQTLRENQDPDIWTNTVFPLYQTYQFTRIYNLYKIIGTLFYNDDRKYSYEVEYLNLSGQWESLYNADNIYKDAYIQFTQLLPAQGIRFRGTNDKNQIFHLNKLTILAEVGYPQYSSDVDFNKQVLQIFLSDYDKKKIVNILENQQYYKMFCNNIVLSKKQMVKKLNDESKFSIQDIVDNIDQSKCLITPKDKWLTFEFPKKYKLKQITITLYYVDKRLYNYELQILNKDNEWIRIQKAQDCYKDIDINLIKPQSAFGLRIQGCSDPNPYIHINKIGIWAQQGLPLYDQE